jgi:tetratricopeptide (TPR) repeat protein
MILTSINDRPNAKLDPQLEYRALVRSIKYSKGFELLFVQCAPVKGEELIVQIRQDLPQKRVEVLSLSQSTENLYDQVELLCGNHSSDVLFIRGIEHSLYEYEKNRLWDDDSQRRSYSDTGAPRLLQHLNLSRERFQENFPFCFVFLMPYFALKYFIHRAPDFFDWSSGRLEFSLEQDQLHQASIRATIKQWQKQGSLELDKNKCLRILLEIQDLIEEHNQKNEDIFHLLVQQGRLFDVLDHHENAISSYNKALKIKPDDYEVWKNRGSSLSKLERYEEAISSYEKALSFDPAKHDFSIWNDQGIALQELGRYEEAINCHFQATKIKNDDPIAWMNLELLTEITSNRINFNGQGFFNQGNVLLDLRRYRQAVVSYDKALEIRPDNDEAWYNRSTALFNLGRYEEAITSYDKVLQFNPSKHEVFYNKARCCAFQTDTEAAIANLNSAIDLNPDKYRDRAKTDLDFYSIRQDERFQALVNVN